MFEGSLTASFHLTAYLSPAILPGEDAAAYAPVQAAASFPEDLDEGFVASSQDLRVFFAERAEPPDKG